jgi:hypothetical protein
MSTAPVSAPGSRPDDERAVQPGASTSRPWVSRRDIVFLVLAAAAFALLAPRAMTRPTPQPSIDLSTAIGRPYAADSVWNTPIAADAAVDPRSAELVESIRVGPTDGAITSDPTQYAFPVYEVGPTTPRYDVPCVTFSCTIVTESGAERVRLLEDVPIPDHARPSAGSDGSMIIIDPASGREWDMWQVQREADGSTRISNGSVYNIRWDGAPPEYGSRGAGVPYLAGLVRHWEIEADRLEHAIAFAYPNVRRERCVWPASKTDGTSRMPNALPEGARLQLDPALTDADFERMGLSRAGRIIARALQRYGMVLIDVSGRAKIIAEDLTANPSGGRSWSNPATELTEATIAAIPLESFRVLALPEGWAEGRSAGQHGRCAR